MKSKNKQCLWILSREEKTMRDPSKKWKGSVNYHSLLPPFPGKTWGHECSRTKN